jgi:hypothetical protein
MALEFPQHQNINQDFSLLSISPIILLKEQSTAEWFIDRIYPLLSNCLVVSRDGFFPRHQQLFDSCLRALAEDRDMVLVVFNIDSLEGIKIVTQRILCMDDLLMADYRSHPAYEKESLNLNEFKIAKIIDSFIKQWGTLQRAKNLTSSYIDWKAFRDMAKGQWTRNLIKFAPPSFTDLEVKEISFQEIVKFWKDVDHFSDPRKKIVQIPTRLGPFQQEIPHPRSICYGLFDNGILIGVTQIYEFKKNWIRYRTIHIRKPYRGRDFGWQFLKSVIKRDWQNYDALFGWVRNSHIDWSLQRGFSRVSNSDEDDHAPMVIPLREVLRSKEDFADLSP